MKTEEGLVGVNTIIQAIAKEGINPPLQMTLDILNELLKEKVYKILDDQCRVFSAKKLESTIHCLTLEETKEPVQETNVRRKNSNKK